MSYDTLYNMNNCPNHKARLNSSYLNFLLSLQGKHIARSLRRPADYLMLREIDVFCFKNHINKLHSVGKCIVTGSKVDGTYNYHWVVKGQHTCASLVLSQHLRLSTSFRSVQLTVSERSCKIKCIQRSTHVAKV